MIAPWVITNANTNLNPNPTPTPTPDAILNQKLNYNYNPNSTWWEILAPEHMSDHHLDMNF